MKMQEALRDSMQDFFQQFAYLDLAVKPGSDAASNEWTLSARVTCDDGTDEVTVFFRPDFVRLIAEGFTGEPECPDSGMPDLVLEVANILAGQAYEITHGGRRPASISQPAWLTQEDAKIAWANSSPEHRFVLDLDGQTQGGVLFSIKEAWSSQWV